MSPPIEPARVTRIDLHLHSRASTDSGSWFLNRVVMPESYTEPEDAYRLAKGRGMDFVALTDHNTISGALEIAHHPDVVVGVEATCEFPEDRIPLHVLVWGIDEAQWADVDRLRGNLYEMVDYLDQAGVPCALAHPLHRVGDRLTDDHIERCLLLFHLWEGINGARPEVGNEVGMRIARAASLDLLERLAEKHGIAPRLPGPLALTGGSDDHGSYDVACAWTETPPAADAAELLDHLRAGRVEPRGEHGSFTKLAHSVGALGVKAYVEMGYTSIPRGLRGIVGDLLQHRLPEPTDGAKNGHGNGHRPGAAVGEEVLSRLRADRRLIRRYRSLGRAPEGSERSHARLGLATGWLHQQLVRRALDPRSLSLTTIGRRMEALAGATLLALPYLVAANYLSGEAHFAEDVEREFLGPPVTKPGPVPAVMVTDTYSELNGVAGTMRRLAGFAAANPERRLLVVTCGGGGEETPGRRDLEPIASFPLPAYGDSAWRLGVPSAVDLLRVVEESGAKVVHAATPGPMGLTALVVARALGLPFLATYHTELTRYVLDLTGDRLAAELTDRGVRWFYGQAERVYVPTRATGAGLLAAGIEPERMFSFTRGIDVSLFHPERRSRMTRRKLGGRDAQVIVYVGRLSVEKGLPLLIEAFKRALRGRPKLRLCLVGEGPGQAQFERRLAGTPHRFLGPLRGEALAATYASADIFCLPSATETFGQVIVEAAASGLPAVVLDQGASAEQVVDGESGLVVPADDPDALAEALGRLADDEQLRRRMGARGRELALDRPGWSEVFEELLDGYADAITVPAPQPGGGFRAGRWATA